MTKILQNDKSNGILNIRGDYTMSNPFNISFGEEPINMISRENELKDIISTFESEQPETKTYIITGPRGSGKTVLLSKVKEHFEQTKNWLTIELNPYIDMLEQLASKIYDKGKIKHLFLKTEFNFSFHGLSFSIKGENPITNVASLLDLMFEYLNKKNIKVLISIDDISSNEFVRPFIHSYQSFIREKYKVFIIISGLYENVSNLESEKSLTFLLRAPKVYLSNLSLREISYSYKDIFNIDDKTSIKLAKLTNGYAYAYQLLGNLLYKDNLKDVNKTILEKYDLQLENNVYSIIWKSLSNKEKDILIAIAKTNGKIKDILIEANMSNSALQVYKKRLLNNGLIDTNTRGIIIFNLPRFKDFVLFQNELLTAQ